MLTVTERRVRSDVSESHQEEVKKPEEQASVVTQTAEFPESASTTVDSPRGKLKSMCARMTTRRKLRSSVRHYQEGDELAREQLGDQRIQQVRRCPTLIDLPVHQIQEQRVEVQRVIHNQECMQQQKYGVSNSSLKFERLRTQERIAERLTKETVSNARQKTLTHRCSTLS